MNSKTPALLYLYFLLFFVSGISGLIYESIWSHYLKLFLGHAAYSQTLVLVIYMGGMAIGAWVAGSRTGRYRNLLKGYALVECILGIAALGFHHAFQTYTAVSYTTVIPALSSPALISAYKWITASLIILPQSILLGATFPLMAVGILRRFPGLSGYKISVIYFVNTLGASLGVLVCGFYLMDVAGLQGAMSAGGALDILVGLAIFLLCRNDDALLPAPVPSDPARVARSPRMESPPPFVHGGYLPLLMVSGLTAAASFIYEIGWIRMLSLVLGSSNHSFELMLSAFILGLALGSFFIRNRIDSLRNLPLILGIVQVVMGVTALLTIYTYGNMFRFMEFVMHALSRSEQGYLLFNIFGHAICLLVMLPSTICAGMVIPLIIQILHRQGYGSETVGRVYAVNTFGGIVGVAAATAVLMPLVGLRLLIVFGAAIDILIGLYVLWAFQETRESRINSPITMGCAVFVVMTLAVTRIDPLNLASGVFRHGYIRRDKKIISHHDGRTASVTLFKRGNTLVLATNGKPDATVDTYGGISGDEYTMALLGVLPLAVTDDAESAAIIGIGAGMTPHFLLYDTTLTHVDVVEIEPAMARAAKRFGKKVENTFSDPRCRIHFDDAKTFFSARNRTYDIIISEPSNPWVSGVSGLFSREFFSTIRRHINPGGILVQWHHQYESDISIMVSILKALREYFPQYEIYEVGSDLIIIASADTSADISLKRDVYEIEPLAQRMWDMGFWSLDDLKLIRLAHSRSLDPLIDTYAFPANSDFRPFVDLNSVKHRFVDGKVEEFADLRTFMIPVFKFAELDTGYRSLDFRLPCPDLENLADLYTAKKLHHELTAPAETRSSHDLGSAVGLILDYASLAPKQLAFEQFDNAVLEALESTLPYLSAREMRELWNGIERTASALTLSESDREWMEFYRSLCLYDFAAINATARKLLLSHERIEDTGINRILLTAFLLSSYRLKRTEGIAETRTRYSGWKDPIPSLRLASELAGRMEENRSR